MNIGQLTKIITVSILSIATSAVMTLSRAACPPPCGWYVEGNFGKTEVSNLNFGTGITTSSSNSVGLNFNFGAKFSRWFALEGGFTKYSNLTLTNSTGTQTGKDQFLSADAVVKGILPFYTMGVDLFGKLGVARLNAQLTIGGVTTTTNTNGIFLGAGAEYAFFQNTMANIQWARVKGNSKTGNIDFYSIGFAYYYG